MAPVRRRNPRYGRGSIRSGSIRGGVLERQRSILNSWEVIC